jgi:hypothetical protein
MRFQVFNNGRPFDGFNLRGAYLFGTDGIAIRRSQVQCKGGFIECSGAPLQASGLALVWPVEGCGSFILPTTCLRPRKHPYNLNMEIARAKLMQAVNKLEDWTFFNRTEGLGEIPRDALGLFIKSVQSVSDYPLASKLADESLKKTLAFSEKLTLKQADTLFRSKSGSHGFGRGTLGCQVDPDRVAEPGYLSRLVEFFGFVTIPADWGSIEVSKGAYDFSRIDTCVEMLAARKVGIGMGPLLRFSRACLPGWLIDEAPGFERVRERAYQFVSTMANRYNTAVRVWSVVGCLNAENYLGFSFEQVLEMTRAASMAVKGLTGRAVKIVEVSEPWGEYYAARPNTLPPLVYVDMVIQSGISFDAFGLRMQFGNPQSEGPHMRDIMQISAMLDCFQPLAKPLYVTAVDVAGGNGNAGGGCAWSQDHSVDRIFSVALSKQFINAVVYGSLADRAGGRGPDNGLLNEKLEPRKSFHVLRKLNDAIFSTARR